MQLLAVLASTTSGNPVYTYSGWLMGYIHLGNALYPADPEAWQAVRDTLPDTVRAIWRITTPTGRPLRGGGGRQPDGV